LEERTFKLSTEDGMRKGDERWGKSLSFYKKIGNRGNGYSVWMAKSALYILMLVLLL
jgi:hypothetical protein